MLPGNKHACGDSLVQQKIPGSGQDEIASRLLHSLAVCHFVIIIHRLYQKLPGNFTVPRRFISS